MKKDETGKDGSGRRGVHAATETALGPMGPHHRYSETSPEGGSWGCPSPGESPSAPSPGLVSSSSLPLCRWQHDKVPLVLQTLFKSSPSGALLEGGQAELKKTDS